MAIVKRKVQSKNQGASTVLKTVTLHKSGAQTVASLTEAFVMPENGTYVSAVAHLGTVSTGATTFKIDVNKNGTTLYTTQTRRPIIADGAASKTSTETATADITGLVKGNVLTVDVDAVGNTIAGSDLSVVISYLADAA